MSFVVVDSGRDESMVDKSQVTLEKDVLSDHIKQFSSEQPDAKMSEKMVVKERGEMQQFVTVLHATSLQIV